MPDGSSGVEIDPNVGSPRLPAPLPVSVSTVPAASFRDPAGFCFALDERILRIVHPASLPALDAFLGSAAARKFLDARQLIPSHRLADGEVNALRAHPLFLAATAGRDIGAVFEHERVAFPSFPHEWPPEMLHAAGRLTLDLAEAALDEDFTLKDATPGNVLFRGSEPVFVDLLSFERRAAGDPVWKPYAQFVRTFLLPLLAHRTWGVPLADVFTTRRDGLSPEEMYRRCGPWQKIRPPFLGLVSLPTWLARKTESGGQSIYAARTLSDPEKARFIVRTLFGSLRRRLHRLEPPASPSSVWSGYMEAHSYSDETFQLKQAFVRDALAETRPGSVLDVGANTGHFSALAAEAGARVVAIDTDAACAGALWRRAREKGWNILPLVVDLARPAGGLGWRNRECPGFLERARGHFDAVLMLAVLHHLLVTERVPLGDILSLAAELTTAWLVIEFVGPEDDMFRRLARGRDDLFTGLNPSVFEAACRERFEIRRATRLAGTARWMYLLRKKTG